MLSINQINRLIEIYHNEGSYRTSEDLVLADLELVELEDGVATMSNPIFDLFVGDDSEATRANFSKFKGWDDTLFYVNVYEVTREFGGSEEGGWYYNNYRTVESLGIVNYDSAFDTLELKEDEYGEQSYGDIYSSIGGVEYRVYIELEKGARETKGRPIYE